VERWTVRKILGEGVNRLGSTGARVIVGRNVGVKVGSGVGVSVGSGVPVPGVPVGSSVLSTNRSGVFVGPSEKGVAVGAGELVSVGVPKKGIETGSPLHPESRKIRIRTRLNFFIRPR
jgi:hypothetical protein